MVIVRKSKYIELSEFFKMNKQNHLGLNLSIKSLESHQREFKNSNVIFLSIIHCDFQLAGYIILVIDKNNIQFKRILVDKNHLGIGQEAITAMEKYCTTQFNISRIWLDVYKSNRKAIHIYKKLGYKCFKESKEESRTVLFYEKMFQR